MKCPDCSSEIAQTDVNVAKDILMCRKCNKFFSISTDIMGETANQNYEEYNLETFDIQSPPSGAWIQEEISGDILVGATMRSFLTVFFVVFSLIWDTVTIGAISTMLNEGEENGEIWIFILTFGSIALIVTFITVFMLLGKTEIRINHASAEVFVGAFSIGWRKFFDWREVEVIEEGWSNVTVNNKRQKNIVVQTSDEKSFDFGSGLSDTKRVYIFKTLLKYHKLFRQKGL